MDAETRRWGGRRGPLAAVWGVAATAAAAGVVLDPDSTSMQIELLDRPALGNPGRARERDLRMIEAFYNPIRHHSAVGYRRPIEREPAQRRPGRSMITNRSRPGKRGQVSVRLTPTR